MVGVSSIFPTKPRLTPSGREWCHASVLARRRSGEFHSSEFRSSVAAGCLRSRSPKRPPFETGADSLVDFTLTIATSIAILIVIGLAIAAAVGKISWGWVIVAIVGIAAIFGAPQIVAWIRSMFGV